MINLFLSHNPHRRWLILVLLFLPLLLFGLIRLADAAAVVSFTSQTSYNVGAGPYWAATFNKFGKPAIAVTNQDANSVSVLYGNYVNGQYDGTFGAATTYSLVTGAVTAPAPQQVVAGNLGQLSLPSLVIAAAGADKVAVLLGNSDDSFQSPVYYNVGTFPESVALGDINNDGNLDIIAANYNSSTISVLLGNSDRTFQSQQTYATSPNPESIVVADLNNDGKLDVATVNSGTNPGKVNVLLNENGTFPSAVTSDVGAAPFSLAVGDFNGDGKVDIVTANHGGGVSVLLNNGVRPFLAVAPAPIPAGNGPFSVAVADFNLDGQADIAVSNADNGGSVGILPNSGGSFQALQASNTFSTGPNPFFIAAGDFNVDGKPDIVTPNHSNPVVNPGTISVLLNTALPFASPPPNDNFSAAQNLNGAVSGRVTGTNVGATHETGEPSHAGFNGPGSVWYTWTAPANGAMTFDTFGSSFNTALAVYTGSGVSTLTLVASSTSDYSPSNDLRRTSRVRFRAEAGTTYRIAVDGLS
ncbi:MAG TPA: VCBS repeat-containing protein, partial [Pyrinomonadaceae bacterium]|nr:VCBS repeat-containing protein [Pyrinomonadaceae bacterium]